MAKIRDAQRAKVYRAEQAAFNNTPHGISCGLEAANNLYNRLACGIFARNLVAPVRILINNRLKVWNWSYMDVDPRIEFNSTDICAWVLTHELAHHIAYRRYGDNDKIADHGPEFVAVYLIVVLELLGPKAADMLARCFRAADVKRNDFILAQFHFPY